MNLRTFIRLLALMLGAASATGAAAGELTDTSWRLVRTMSMDDSVYVPDDRAKFTLELQADGTAAMRADCNRGTGTWTSQTADRLQFGSVAATRVHCPPGSLSDRYLAEFEWVRSYVLRDG